MPGVKMPPGKAIQHSDFSKQLDAFEAWKSELLAAIVAIQNWLEENQFGDIEYELRMREAIHALRTDRLTIAFVAEFSRGKTELINAIFFADYKRRLLHSEAGRTTMCPTELFFDEQNQESYIRLLPVETRLLETSINDLRYQVDEWTTIPLDLNNPDQLSAALQEVTKTKEIPFSEAQRLGLHGDDSRSDHGTGTLPATAIVPKWRHALISFPHPLLKQGLTILDTPGLNSLGAEPELTLTMLPNAQAVLFVLAADTGVTRSDLEMWRSHIQAFARSSKNCLIAALNKIDTLWDEMKTADAVTASIEKQRNIASKTLGIETQRIFPVSAYKGLIGKIKKDNDLIASSGIQHLESYLAEEILPAKQRIVWANIVSEIGALLSNTRTTISTRLAQLTRQRDQLQGLKNKNTELSKNAIFRVREQQNAYLKNVAYYENAHDKLMRQTRVILNTLSLKAVDRTVAETRKGMVESLTTVGLKKNMSVFFDSVRDTIQVATVQADQAQELVTNIYKRFHDEHGLPQIRPGPLEIEKYKDDLNRLYLQASEFRDSPSTTMTEQSFLIKKFFISLVSHVRQIFMSLSQEAERWQQELIGPLDRQVRDNRENMERHMETLNKIDQSRHTLGAKVEQLEQECKILETQLADLDALHADLLRSQPDARQKPGPERRSGMAI